MGKVILVGAMVAGMLASCGKDDDFFAPPSDLSTSGIVQLVKDANTAAREAPQLSLTSTGTQTEEGVSYTLKEEIQVNKASLRR